jgi:RNA polymerase sigma-70 factor, ECF subfamily
MPSETLAPRLGLLALGVLGGRARTEDPATLSDDDLVRRCLGGDRSAFNQLVERYQRPLYNFCYRMAGNGEDANDLTQDTFVRAYGALARFRPGSNFSTWLFAIANNACIDLVRTRQRRGDVSLDFEVEEGREPADKRPQPDVEVARGDQAARVQAAVQTLPDKYRAVVVMRHLQDMPVEEIGRIMGLPVGTVKTHLFRGRELLRRRLTGVVE